MNDKVMGIGNIHSDQPGTGARLTTQLTQRDYVSSGHVYEQIERSVPRNMGAVDLMLDLVKRLEVERLELSKLRGHCSVMEGEVSSLHTMVDTLVALNVTYLTYLGIDEAEAVARMDAAQIPAGKILGRLKNAAAAQAHKESLYEWAVVEK